MEILKRQPRSTYYNSKANSKANDMQDTVAAAMMMMMMVCRGKKILATRPPHNRPAPGPLTAVMPPTWHTGTSKRETTKITTLPYEFNATRLMPKSIGQDRMIKAGRLARMVIRRKQRTGFG